MKFLLYSHDRIERPSHRRVVFAPDDKFNAEQSSFSVNIILE